MILNLVRWTGYRLNGRIQWQNEGIRMDEWSRLAFDTPWNSCDSEIQLASSEWDRRFESDSNIDPSVWLVTLMECMLDRGTR